MYFPLENSCLASLSQCICSSLKGRQTSPPGTPLPSQQCPDWVNTAAKQPARERYSWLCLPPPAPSNKQVCRVDSVHCWGGRDFE